MTHANIRNIALINVDVHGGSRTGGLVGDNGLVIAASYVTGSVSGTGKVGGLAGDSFGGRILTSYSTGSVTGTGVVGGLVGGNFGNTGTATDSYWDTQTSGQSESAGGEGKTTSELQSPTGYTGIYESWNLDLDGVGDDLWDFGTASQYPALKPLELSLVEQRQ